MTITTSTTKLKAPNPEALRSTATDRAYGSFLRAVGRETTKANRLELERAKAFGETMPRFLETLDEEALAGFFFAIERVASASNRKKIATHPLRPDVVDELLAEAVAQDAAKPVDDAAAATFAPRPSAKAAEANEVQEKADQA